jgi:hypothetical protein
VKTGYARSGYYRRKRMLDEALKRGRRGNQK